MRALGIGLLLLGSVLALATGMLMLLVHGGTCSPHEGGSGCGFSFVLAIPWIVALGLAGGAVVLNVRQR